MRPDFIGERNDNVHIVIDLGTKGGDAADRKGK